MSHRLLIFFLLLLSPLLVQAQEEREEFRVIEDGGGVEIPNDLRDKLSSHPDSARTLLLECFFAEGYLNARLDSLSEKTATVNKGCLFDLKGLNIRFKEHPDSLTSEKLQESYTEQFLKTIIQEKLFELEQQGFPFAKADIAEFIIDSENCSVSVDLTIEKGIKAEATDIYFPGAQSTSQEYLRKISGFRSGQLITPNYLQFLRSRLISSTLFQELGNGQLVLREGKPVVLFEVQERSLNVFDGLLGYVPDATGRGQIVGDVELSLWSVVVPGNGINFQYKRLRPETSELMLEVSQDWIGDIPIGISAGFEIYQNDTTYQARDFNVNGYYRVGTRAKVIGGIGFQSTISGSDLPQVTEPDGRKRTTRLGFEFSNLDNYDVPTSGTSLKLILGIANKNLQEDSLAAFTQNLLELNASQYIPIFDRSVLAASLNGFLLESNRVTANDLIRFGGANSFRGYSEDQFRAGAMFWGDVEYRFLVDRSSFLFVFGAGGRYHRPKLITESASSFEVTDNLISTGFGLSYQTRIGRLKFTYAISPEESIANGKVHFGIRTEL
ncbi:MAG: BamA/TamA family outer membrane protein [Gracilimonas sp.]